MQRLDQTTNVNQDSSSSEEHKSFDSLIDLKNSLILQESSQTGNESISNHGHPRLFSQIILDERMSELKGLLNEFKRNKVQKLKEQRQAHNLALQRLLQNERIRQEKKLPKYFPKIEIKLVSLMKIIIDANWVIDEQVFADMLQVVGYDPSMNMIFVD